MIQPPITSQSSLLSLQIRIIKLDQIILEWYVHLQHLHVFRTAGMKDSLNPVALWSGMSFTLKNLFLLASSRSENIQGIVNHISLSLLVFPRKGFHSALPRLQGKFLHNALDMTQIKLNSRQRAGLRGVRKPDPGADQTWMWTYNILWVRRAAAPPQQEDEKVTARAEVPSNKAVCCWVRMLSAGFSLKTLKFSNVNPSYTPCYSSNLSLLWTWPQEEKLFSLFPQLINLSSAANLQGVIMNSTVHDNLDDKSSFFSTSSACQTQELERKTLGTFLELVGHTWLQTWKPLSRLNQNQRSLAGLFILSVYLFRFFF